jgi:glyoxylase-like metal-dependent hydrolase (beta-lactamase superfamily II)
MEWKTDLDLDNILLRLLSSPLDRFEKEKVIYRNIRAHDFELGNRKESQEVFRGMIIERSMHGSWLSNTYLVSNEPGGKAVLIDSGGPIDPILEKIEKYHLSPTHIFCTHHHHDHIAHNDFYKERFACAICAHPLERNFHPSLDFELDDGAEIVTGDLRIRALHIPGHSVGQLAFLVNDSILFTGDTLFRGSVGGTCGSSSTSFEDLRRSIMDILMKFPGDTQVFPGHTDPTTISEEWENNPFIRAWRGLDELTEQSCTALGKPADLLLRAKDYDGGTKCWVRFVTDNKNAIAPGSQVR